MNRKIIIVILMIVMLVVLIQGLADFSTLTRFEFQHVAGDNEVINPKDCRGQTFTSGINGSNVSISLRGVSIIIDDGGSSSPNNVTIYETNATGGIDFAETKLAENITIEEIGSVAWYNITMPSVVLNQGQTYGMVVCGSDGGGNINWRFTTAPYDGGTRQEYNASDWSTNTGQDAAFEVYGIPLETNLNSPANDTLSINPVTFNCTGSGDTIVNITLFIDNILNHTITGGGDSIALEQQRNLSTLEHNWTCAINDAVGITWAAENFTLRTGDWEENSQTFSASTFEGNTETFSINITATTGVQISTATLHYNNTEFVGSITSIGADARGDQFELSRTLDIESLSASANVSLFWEILTSSAFTDNSTSNNQSIFILSLDDCGSNAIPILNFTQKDEDTQEGLPATSNDTVIEIDMDIFPTGSSTPIIEFSQNYTQINPARVCLNENLGNSVYDMDVDVRYDAENYANEFYHIQNFTLQESTASQNISLFSLADSRAQKFTIIFKDITFIPVDNALIDVTRNYIDEGVFKTVEIAKTDSDGQTVAQLVVSETIYTFIVSKFGETLATFENVKAICEDQTIGKCTINLNALSTSTSPEDFSTVGGLSYTMDFDKDARTITTVFSTLDGSVSIVQLNATKFDRWGNNTVCSDLLTSSSGTLTCNIPQSFGNLTVVSTLFNNGNVVDSRIFTIPIDPVETFNYNAAFMLLIMVMTIPLMFITSGLGVVFGAILGFIVALMLSLYTGFSLVGVGSSLIWLIVAGAILMWKINELRAG